MDKLNDAKVLERQNRRLKFSSKISLNADTIGNLYNKEIQYDDWAYIDSNNYSDFEVN